VRRLRVDLRLVVAAVLALVAGLGVLALTRPPERVAVLLAADQLPSGTRVVDAALREAQVEPLDGLLLASDLEAFSDWTFDVAVPADSPLTMAMLSPPRGITPDVVALTLERGHAVQGLLAPGDLVDIYVTNDGGTGLLASRVQVVYAEIGSSGLGASDVSLLLAIDDKSMTARLVTAIHSASMDLVLVTP
jgi:hypothetical protein